MWLYIAGSRKPTAKDLRSQPGLGAQAGKDHRKGVLARAIFKAQTISRLCRLATLENAGAGGLFGGQENRLDLLDLQAFLALLGIDPRPEPKAAGDFLALRGQIFGHEEAKEEAPR